MQVLYTAGKAAEWYHGIVSSHDPESKSEPFLIVFDDGDKEKGRIGVSTFLSLKKERSYKWLDAVDTTRPSIQDGATDRSLDSKEEDLKQASQNGAATAVDAEQTPPTEKRSGAVMPKYSASL